MSEGEFLLPHLLKGGATPDGKPVRPLGRLMVEPAVAPSRDTGPDSEAKPGSVEPVEGRLHGPQPSSESFERVQRLLHEMVMSFSRQRDELLAELRPSIVRLVVGMARRVVGRELRTDREAIRRTIDEAVSELGRSGRIVARTAPPDAAELRRAIDDGLWTPPTMVELDIVADPAVSPGGCVLESDYGSVDATIATQLDELARTLELDMRPED